MHCIISAMKIVSVLTYKLQLQQKIIIPLTSNNCGTFLLRASALVHA